LILDPPCPGATLRKALDSVDLAAFHSLQLAYCEFATHNLDISLKLQRKEEERKRQAEAEEAQERINREHQEQERKWWAESQARQEKMRKIRLEEVRNRPPPPQPRLVWKRRPEEIRRRWAESEFEKWRQRRGLSREEVPASVREAFIRDRS
jgi:cobalamin-dependent methionine synthase I